MTRKRYVVQSTFDGFINLAEDYPKLDDQKVLNNYLPWTDKEKLSGTIRRSSQ